MVTTMHCLPGLCFCNADDMSYSAITAMLGSDDQLDSLPDNCLDDGLHPAACQQQPPDAVSAHANTLGVKTEGSAFTDHAETCALDLPSVPPSSALPARINATQTGCAETEEDLFARFTALKASTAAPVEDLNHLTDRLAVLKGPKVTAAELQDLESRLEVLTGGKNTVPLSELEGRLAKLKSTLPASIGQLGQLKGRSERQLISDFDPDIELNQEQLEALASLGDSYAENSPFEQCLIESTDPQKQPPIKPTPANVAAASPSDLRQVLQNFGLEDEDCISEQQLRALASLPTTGAAGTPQSCEGVPQWAAALGMSAQDLQHGSDPEKCLKSGSSSSESSEHVDAYANGRRVLALSAARQAPLTRLKRQKLLRKTRT